jgi:hypothetical protein
MAERIHELLLRNLQEVFGEGDPTKRRSAIKELYTDECVLYVPRGTFVGHDALDKFAGDLRATHPHFAYAPCCSPSSSECRAPKVGLWLALAAEFLPIRVRT